MQVATIHDIFRLDGLCLDQSAAIPPGKCLGPQWVIFNQSPMSLVEVVSDYCMQFRSHLPSQSVPCSEIPTSGLAYPVGNLIPNASIRLGWTSYNCARNFFLPNQQKITRAKIPSSFVCNGLCRLVNDLECSTPSIQSKHLSASFTVLLQAAAYYSTTPSPALTAWQDNQPLKSSFAVTSSILLLKVTGNESISSWILKKIFPSTAFWILCRSAGGLHAFNTFIHN